MKLMEEKENEKNQKRAKSAGNLLQDNRFQALFQNPDFQVDTNAEEYRYACSEHMVYFNMYYTLF